MSSDLFDLSGKLALITGSGRGIGFMLAKGLGQAGCEVILNARDQARLETAVSLLRQEGVVVHRSVFDVTDENAIAEQVARIENKIGGIDILVNNAGIQIRAPLHEFPTDDWRRLLDVHLTGAFLVAKAVVKGMIQRRSGKIINICSIQSELARPTIAPYTAAKGGLKNLTKGMATDWGQYNIQANGIAPGYFKTEMTRSLYEDKTFDAWLCARVPAHRWGEPEELIGAAVFLASKASDYVNGHILYVDGGLTACV